MSRYVVPIILTVLIAFVFSPSMVSAQAPEITIFVEDRWLELDVPPIIQEGRTLVPMRAPLEALGSYVEWDGAEQKITVEKDELIVEMWIGNLQARINGNTATMDVPPMLRQGRTLIPLRFVSEELGENVLWDPDYYAVGINAAPADIFPQKPFRETSIAGVRLLSTDAEVRDALGSPSHSDSYYSDFLDGYELKLYYPFGEFTFFEDEEMFSLYQVEISNSERAGGPRNIRLGDSTDDVLRKFPDHDNPMEEQTYRDGYYRVLYGEYEHLQEYGVVLYNSNEEPQEILFSTEDHYGFKVYLENGFVSSMQLLIELN